MKKVTAQYSISTNTGNNYKEILSLHPVLLHSNKEPHLKMRISFQFTSDEGEKLKRYTETFINQHVSSHIANLIHSWGADHLNPQMESFATGENDKDWVNISTTYEDKNDERSLVNISANGVKIPALRISISCPPVEGDRPFIAITSINKGTAIMLANYIQKWNDMVNNGEITGLIEGPVEETVEETVV